MELKIRKLNKLEIIKLSNLLKNYSCEALLKTGKYCIDGKSVLGIISAMAAADGDITLEINELDNTLLSELSDQLTKFVEKK